MPAISSLTRPDIVEAVAEVGGEQIRVRFDRNRLTLNWGSRMAQAQTGQDTQLTADLFGEVISEWDITNEDGSYYPPTGENLAKLPGPVVVAIVGAMNTAAVPGEAEGKALPDTSAAASQDSSVTEPPSRNGAATSMSPLVSASQSTS